MNQLTIDVARAQMRDRQEKIINADPAGRARVLRRARRNARIQAVRIGRQLLSTGPVREAG